MDTLLTQALTLALLRAMPGLAKPRRCNEHGVGSIIRELRATLPDNGIGPQISARKDLIHLLEANCKTCPSRGKCGIVLLP